jgi:DNA mismatch repair protein MutS
LIATIHNMHFTAIEHQDSIVFMHALQHGAASQSFGLQVAKLAGVPIDVIHSAKKKLSELEISPKIGQQAEINFSAETPVKSAFFDRLMEIDINAITPLDALQLLQAMQKEAGDIKALI